VNKAASASVYTRVDTFSELRKEEIVGTIAEPRKGTGWRVIHENRMREPMGLV
jgi:hypothetical protein